MAVRSIAVIGAGRECGIRAHRGDSRCGHGAAAGQEHRPTGRAFARPPLARPAGAATMGSPVGRHAAGLWGATTPNLATPR